VELRLLSDAKFGEEFDMMVDSIVDEYLEDELSPEDRERTESHFFKSAKRREKLEFAAALKKRKEEVLRGRERRKRWTPYLMAAAVAVVAIGVGTISLRIYLAGPSLSQGLTALHRAYREQRPLESRISGFSYAQAPDQRGGVLKFDAAQKDLAGTILLGKDSPDASADVQHAIGQFYLSQRNFDKAIEYFERSLSLDADNSLVHSDLGVALLERGKLNKLQSETGESNEDFADSLPHLNKALALDNTNLEALFNRALLYREMGLLSQSEKDWQEYLQKDSTSEWANEARSQLKELEHKLAAPASTVEQSVEDYLEAYEQEDERAAWEVVRRNYSSAGNTIANALLDSYLESDLKADTATAETKLEALTYLGKLELQTAGDTFTAELTRFYKRSNFQQRRNLAHARAKMAEAYDLFLGSHIDDALRAYSEAEQTFRENGDECEATLATYRIGHCYWQKPDLKKSREIFTHLRETTEHSNYRWLFNQSIYRTASLRFTYNDYTESIDYASQALKQSEQMGDFVGTLNALIMLADQYRSIRNYKQSWPYIQRALVMVNDKGAEPLQIWGLITGIAQNLTALGWHEAALEYQKEALRRAFELQPERPLIISRSYAYLALTYARLKNYEAAQTNINLAFENGRRLENENSGREMMANTLLFAGDFFKEAQQYDNAIQSYDRSIALYDDLNYPYYTYPARKGRLECFIAKGNDAATENELKEVLNLFDYYRKTLTRESQRNTFFNVEQSVYDLAIDFAWARKHDSEKALEYCELSRGRSLLDAMRRTIIDNEPDDDLEKRLPSTGTPLPVSDVKRLTPDDAQIVQFAVLREKVLIWVIAEKQVKTFEQPIRSTELAKLVRRFVDGVGTLPGKAEPTLLGDAKELHKLLIAPIESLLDETKLTCIVPDKELHYLPFGALVSEATGRYVIEKFRVQLAPSASISLESLRGNGKTVQNDEDQVLSVGDPRFDSRAFPSLQPLPAASAEAQTIASLYKPQSVLLLDRNATERAVRSALRNANVAHFALHYVVDDRHSLYSKMVLTPSAKITSEADNGLLQIHEIYKMNLEHMRLVVLAACQTAIEQQYSGEGAIGVARPFLASGVPLVVATLWPVDSSSSAQLMTRFHEHRKQDKLSTAEALQHAQLDMLNDTDARLHHPYYWAAFTVIGRHAKF
jgi:CHAT domain-containing protein